MLHSILSEPLNMRHISKKYFLNTNNLQKLRGSSNDNSIHNSQVFNTDNAVEYKVKLETHFNTTYSNIVYNIVTFKRESWRFS